MMAWLNLVQRSRSCSWEPGAKPTAFSSLGRKASNDALTISPHPMAEPRARYDATQAIPRASAGTQIDLIWCAYTATTQYSIRYRILRNITLTQKSVWALAESRVLRNSLGMNASSRTQPWIASTPYITRG